MHSEKLVGYRNIVPKPSGTKDLVVVLCGWIQAAHHYRGRPGTSAVCYDDEHEQELRLLGEVPYVSQLSFNASYVFHPIATANSFYKWFQPIFFW